MKTPMNAKRLMKTLVVAAVLASLLWASGIAPAIIPANVPTANKQGSTGTKFLIATGAFTAGNLIATDASGNAVDSGGTGGGGGGGGNGVTVYSGPAGIGISGGVTAYFPFGGGNNASTTEADVTLPVAGTVGVDKFSAHLSVALGGPGNSVVFTVRKNAAATTVTCTVTDPAVACSDTTHSVTYAAADTIDVQAVFTGVIGVTPVFVLGAQVGAATSVTATQPYLTVGSTTYGPVFQVTPPLLTDYTWANQGTATATQAAGSSVLFTAPRVATDQVRLLFKPIPTGGTYTVTAGFIPLFNNNNFVQAGIALYDGTKVVTFAVSSDNTSSTQFRAVSNKFNTVSSFSAQYFGQSTYSGWPIWLRIQDDGANRIYFLSHDGMIWSQLFTVAHLDFLTATQWGVYINPTSATSGTPVDTSMNWFHVAATHP